MSDDEVDELLKAVDTSSGEINYTGILIDPFFWEHLADVWPPRPRPNHPRQLIHLCRPLFSRFLPSAIHILQALFFSVHESRVARAGDAHICALISSAGTGSRR